MRRIFVPACICFMTWTGLPGSDSNSVPENFSGTAKTDKKIYARVTIEPGDAEPVMAKIPRNGNIAAVSVEAIEAPAAQPPSQTARPAIIPLPPVLRPVVQRSDREICDSLTTAAQNNNLPVHFFISLLFQESGFNPAEVSTAGALGIAQFMPETAADMGLENPFDPVQAIPASARLLRNLVAQFGNLGLAAAAYNAGPRRVQDWLTKLSNKTATKKIDPKPTLPEETQGYVRTITGHPVETWTNASAALPGQRLPRHAPCQEAAGLYAWSGPETIPLPQPSPLTHRAEAAAQPAKTETKPVSQQLAARKHAIGKHELEKVAQQ
jgi:Transglycosylase SLT domain